MWDRGKVTQREPASPARGRLLPPCRPDLNGRARSALIIAAALLGASTVVVHARAQGIEGRLRECRPIEEDLQRLSCFDQLVADLDAAPAPRDAASSESDDVAVSPAGWTVEATTNPLDDTPRVVAWLRSTEGEGRLGGGGPVELYVRCQSGNIEVFIWWREFLGGSAVRGGKAEVTTRFDKEEPSTRKWNQSTDMQMTFVPVGAEGFAMKLTSRSRLAAMVTPLAASPVTAVFDLAGADRAVEAVRSACRPASEGAG